MFRGAYTANLVSNQSNLAKELGQAPGVAIAAKARLAAGDPTMVLFPAATAALQAKLIAAELATVTVIAKSPAHVIPKAGYLKDFKCPTMATTAFD